MSILLARQPIYDVTLNIVAYELLFRATHHNAADHTDGDKATSEVILNAFTALPVADILEGKPAYINFTAGLLNAPVMPVSIKNVVLEILETVVIDEAALESIKSLRKQGYKIALDDYIYKDGDAPVLESTDIVKVDVLHLTDEQLRLETLKLKPFNLVMLAEKIETHERFELCKSLGYDLFQGYFLSKPQIIEGRKIDANIQTVLHLIRILQDPEVEFDEIERTIASDPTLSFKILRLANSAAFNTGHPIDSILRAIQLLGLQRVRSWGTLIALSNLSHKPTALSINAMTRARLCQLLANHYGGHSLGDILFTVGLLSMLDAFLDMPMAEILDAIRIPDDMRTAILDYSQPYGLFLETVIRLERAEFDTLNLEALEKVGLNFDRLTQDYLESLDWAAETFEYINYAEH